MKEYHFLKPIFHHFHAQETLLPCNEEIEKIEIKKIGKKRRRREKDPIQLYAHMLVNRLWFGFIRRLPTVRADKKSEKYPAENTDRS